MNAYAPGKWYISSRGSNPKPWTLWADTELQGQPTFVELLEVLLWARQGQHVKIEFVPNNLYKDK